MEANRDQRSAALQRLQREATFMFIYSWSYSSDSILTCHCKQRQASEVCAMGSFWLMVIVCACSMQHSMSCCKYWVEIAFHWKFILFWPGALVGSCHSTIGNIQCSWFQSRTCNLPIRLLACTYIKYRFSDFPVTGFSKKQKNDKPVVKFTTYFSIELFYMLHNF